MKASLTLAPVKRGITIFVVGFLMSMSVLAQLPTAQQIASQMKVGWNLGNTLEAICGETVWGNPATTQTLINAVKAAGFNTVRLPCAWDCHATSGVIDAAWLTRVKAVVDYCMNADLYVIINIHWDNGWLENNVTTTAQTSVNAKQQNYWTQIANYFKAYDQRVLFASANEPNVSDATGMSFLLSYKKTFINAVRATGGNNSSRTLVIQGPSTDIEKTNTLMNTMPTDQIANRLMVEVHYYTPWQFCGMTEDASWGTMFYYWGNGYHSTTETSRNATWGEESDVEKYFGYMKSKFVDNGIPVIIGEFGAMKRSNPADLALHIASREYFNKYVVSSAVAKGMIPFYWDNGASEMVLFNRSTGAIVDQGVVNAIMEGAGGNPNVNYTLTVTVNGSGTVSSSPAGTSFSGGTSVTLTATPAANYDFVGWTGDLSGTSNPAVIAMSGNKTVYANFVPHGTGGTGTILREYWNNVAGTTIASLTSNSAYPSNPTGSEQLTLLEGPTNAGDNYGARIRGYIHPSVTGAYILWVAGDDYTDLYLSTSASASGATRIAYVEGWTNSREWGKYTTQKSASVNLTAGQKYYIEVLQKEGSGGDNVAVAWQGPGISQVVIPGNFLSPFVPGTVTKYTLTATTSGTGSVSFSPAGGTYDQGTIVTVTAAAGSGWQFSSWSGDLTGTTNPATITMNSNKSITASFTQVPSTQYTLTVNVTGTGSVSLSPSGGSYASGTSVTLTANAGTGYHFTSWSGDITGSTSPATVVMNANKTVTALFEINQTGGCTNPVTISIPFTYNGSGNFCWVTTTAMAYINSWNLNSLKINGVDYTNVWSNSLPAAQNGQWFIEYSGSYAWSHFEAPQAKSAPLANQSNKVLLFPNPFTATTNLVVDKPEQVDRIVILDQLGRKIEAITHENIKNIQSIGASLNAGIYIIQVYSANGLQSLKVTKNR